MPNTFFASIEEKAVFPALAILPSRMTNDMARVMLLSIGMQESRLTARRQHGDGPARGLWQFERGGGVAGVMRHEATSSYAELLCEKRNVNFIRAHAWKALEFDDVLAAGFARLLLWSDPASLAAIKSPEDGWKLYLRTWRPGKPHVATWEAFFNEARKHVFGGNNAP
jgi:hypothetical protein